MSRDIKDLRLLKVMLPGGSYKYATADKAEKSMGDRLIRMLAESVLGVDFANNLVVVKTLSGSANVAAEALDSMRWPELIGSLAGDNTVLLIARGNDEAKTVAGRVMDLMK